MSYITEGAEWMNPVPSAVKNLITNFFRIGDKPDPDAGNLWADEVFAADGRLVVGENEIVGEQGAWAAIESRRHVVQRVYAGGSDAEDLMLHGVLTQTIRGNGREVQIPFAARMVLQPGSRQTSSPKIQLYQAWAVRNSERLDE
ncbi:hypothetical protein LTS14_004997 [Recurvomyces mirabilis]|uniref:uncharacterized protein n=1 Tax=Recurvomyces mirabilis TaxID=574656 RepID=UPI002DDF89C3|nr:hypothetical protein LTS14_004997 [Recurvomyces mirabilis]